MRLRETADNGLMFWCPGCNNAHCVSRSWKWNGDTDRPTLSPSIMVRWEPDEGARCHSCVVLGKIRFMSDCTHELAGQTVPLAHWPRLH